MPRHESETGGRDPNGWRRPDPADRTDEFQAHLDLLADQLQAMGRSPDQARREARLRFGNPRVKQEEIDRRSGLVSLLHEVRGALRAARRHRGFLVAAMVPLASALALLTVTFSVVDAVLVKPLPYADAERIVQVGERFPDVDARERSLRRPSWAERTIASETVEAWSRQSRTIAAFARYDRPFRTLLLNGARVRVPAASVGVRFFDILGVPPDLGRYFRDEDAVAAAARPAVVLSHGLWRREFGGDPAVVGRAIVIDDQSGIVVGVAPPHLRFPTRGTELWTVLARGEDGQMASGDRFAIARLRPDATIKTAAAEGTVIARRVWNDTHPSEADRPVEMDVVDLPSAIVASAPRGLILLAGAALVVLAASILHSTHLFVVHVQRRAQEFSVRAALGASPWRLTLLVLTSVGAVVLLAGGLALVAAIALHGVVVFLLPADFPRVDEIAFTWRSALVLAGAVCGAALICGGLLAWHVRRRGGRLEGAAVAGGARATAIVRTRAGLALLAGEVAFSCALLIVAGLLVRSFLVLATTDSGYDPDGALTAQVSFPAAMGQGERQEAIERLLGRLEQLESVQAAGASNAVPLEAVKVVFEFDAEAGGAERVRMDFGVISPGYLESIGSRIVEGRNMTWDDRGSTLPVAVVNESFMRRYYPDRDAIGLLIPGAGYTVVGVAADVRLEGPTQPAQPALYVSLLQRTQATFFNRVNVVVRSSGDPMALSGALREAVHDTDTRLALSDVTTLDRQLSEWIARPRLYASVLAVSAVLSVTIVAIGLFAALAYTAGQRRREVAVRLAVGASRGRVARLLLREGLAVVAVGVVLGVGGGIGAGRAIASLLHGVMPNDPYTFTIAPAVLMAAALAAAFVPVAAVLRMDVARALRSE